MNDSRLVNARQALQERERRLLERAPARRGGQAGEEAALDQVHHQEVAGAVDAVVAQARHARELQPAQRGQLAADLDQIGVFGRGDQLDRHAHPADPVEGAPHLAVSAPAERLLELVAARQQLGRGASGQLSREAVVGGVGERQRRGALGALGHHLQVHRAHRHRAGADRLTQRVPARLGRLIGQPGLPARQRHRPALKPRASRQQRDAPSASHERKVGQPGAILGLLRRDHLPGVRALAQHHHLALQRVGQLIDVHVKRVSRADLSRPQHRRGLEVQRGTPARRRQAPAGGRRRLDRRGLERGERTSK